MLRTASSSAASMSSKTALAALSRGESARFKKIIALRRSSSRGGGGGKVSSSKTTDRLRMTRNGPETVPIVVPLPDGSQQDLFTFLVNNRIVFIGERIDEDSTARIVAQMLALEAEAPDEPITVYINATAGTQYCVVAIVDAMEMISCPVKTVAMGCVAGPPLMILAAGTKGERYSMRSARMILAQPLGGLSGTSVEVKLQAIELNRNAKAQSAFIAKYTGQDYEELRGIMTRDTYFGAQEAIDFGLIDHIIE
jgi:ATP-dependent Clp protease protease subunit